MYSTSGLPAEVRAVSPVAVCGKPVTEPPPSPTASVAEVGTLVRVEMTEVSAEPVGAAVLEVGELLEAAFQMISPAGLAMTAMTAPPRMTSRFRRAARRACARGAAILSRRLPLLSCLPLLALPMSAAVQTCPMRYRRQC